MNNIPGQIWLIIAFILLLVFCLFAASFNPNEKDMDKCLKSNITYSECYSLIYGDKAWRNK